MVEVGSSTAGFGWRLPLCGGEGEGAGLVLGWEGGAAWVGRAGRRLREVLVGRWVACECAVGRAAVRSVYVGRAEKRGRGVYCGSRRGGRAGWAAWWGGVGESGFVPCLCSGGCWGGVGWWACVNLGGNGVAVGGWRELRGAWVGRWGGPLSVFGMGGGGR